MHPMGPHALMQATPNYHPSTHTHPHIHPRSTPATAPINSSTHFHPTHSCSRSRSSRVSWPSWPSIRSGPPEHVSLAMAHRNYIVNPPRGPDMLSDDAIGPYDSGLPSPTWPIPRALEARGMQAGEWLPAHTHTCPSVPLQQGPPYGVLLHERGR